MPKASLTRDYYVRLYVPENASTATLGDRLATVYTFTNAAGRPAATAFVRQQAKPVWNYYFRSEEHRAREIAGLFRSISERASQIEERRVQRSPSHAFRPGDVVYASWGYEQTNVDWYRVTRATKSYVWLKRLASVETQTISSMSGVCIPGEELEKPETRHYACGESIRIDGNHGTKWNGQPKHYSTYG